VPRSPFLQPTSSSRAPVETSPSEAVCRAPWENPPAFAFQIHFEAALPRASKKTPDHLAVIRPPTAARLTARCRLRALRLPPWVALSRGEGRALLPCRPATAPSNEPSDTSLRATCRELPEQPVTCRLCPFPPAARQCRRPFRARGAFHPGRPRERPCESSTRSAATLAGGAAAARFHRCSRTPTRPLGRSLS
jgi:hypothetical protein